MLQRRRGTAKNNILCLSAYLLVAMPVYGQPPPHFTETQEANTVAALLNSPVTRDEAWGADLAGKYGLQAFVPHLRRMLRPSSPYGAEAVALHQCVLDALILLGAVVPAEELMPLYPHFPNQVIILLARSPAENQKTLLSLMQEPLTRVRWLAVCNLLAEAKAEGFAAELLREFTIRIDVAVYDRAPTTGIGGGSGGGVSSCGATGQLYGFPSPKSYTLTDHPSRGDVLIARGPHPIYYRRSPAGQGDTLRDRNRYVGEYLALLLDRHPELPIVKPERYHSLIWKNTDQYVSEVASVLAEAKQSHSLLVQGLLEKSLLSRQEAETTRPNIVLDVRDMRGDHSIPLPAVSRD